MGAVGTGFGVLGRALLLPVLRISWFFFSFCSFTDGVKGEAKADHRLDMAQDAGRGSFAYR